MNKRRIMIVGIIVTVLCPIVVLVGTSADVLNWATNDNDWIGFWGGYIGTIITGFLSVVILRETLKDNKNGREREEKIAYYTHIVEIYTSFVKNVANYFDNIARAMNNKQEETYKECMKLGNEAARASIELEMCLSFRDEKCTREILKWEKKISEDINGIIEEFKKLTRGELTYFEETLFDKRMDFILKEINEQQEKMCNALKEELGV